MLRFGAGIFHLHIQQLEKADNRIMMNEPADEFISIWKKQTHGCFEFVSNPKMCCKLLIPTGKGINALSYEKRVH